MGLNIKNERVHALAKEVSRRTGKTQTSAIEEALERMLEQLASAEGDAARHDRLRRLVIDAQAAADSESEPAARQLQNDLYDEHGLPK
ncbi:type II toxin-antitoxin system VapB family antitoxin [Leekyejoonella antrihumi]|uniref:type II toxin-antitoxin system VapB family antitoxin n=1 Tax=Leekyejoonella antrihumi TaxID=1660198 RepID=UPI0016440A5C|nr:type II toxin-antitoxin system VapB family antitoxin [Leekyejoonella antrihumi]